MVGMVGVIRMMIRMIERFAFFAAQVFEEEVDGHNGDSAENGFR